MDMQTQYIDEDGTPFIYLMFGQKSLAIPNQHCLTLGKTTWSGSLVMDLVSLF